MDPSFLLEKGGVPLLRKGRSKMKNMLILLAVGALILGVNTYARSESDRPLIYIQAENIEPKSINAYEYLGADVGFRCCFGYHETPEQFTKRFAYAKELLDKCRSLGVHTWITLSASVLYDDMFSPQVFAEMVAGTPRNEPLVWGREKEKGKPKGEDSYFYFCSTLIRKGNKRKLLGCWPGGWHFLYAYHKVGGVCRGAS